MEESNDELITRRRLVQKQFAETMRRLERLVDRHPFGSRSRTSTAQWAGCLNFTLLQIEDKMMERGLLP